MSPTKINRMTWWVEKLCKSIVAGLCSFIVISAVFLIVMFIHTRGVNLSVGRIFEIYRYEFLRDAFIYSTIAFFIFFLHLSNKG